MSAWRLPATFRGRLTLRWTLAFGLILAAANAAIYVAARAYLARDLDAKVRTLAATELGSSIDGPAIHLHEIPEGALADSDWADKFVQILDADGRVLLQSATLAGLPPLVGPDVAGQGLEGRAPVVAALVHGRRGRAAVLGGRKDAVAFVMVVGLYTGPMEAQLATLAWLLALVWVVALAATGTLGYGLASTALAPVVSITRRASRIATGEFQTRLDPPRVDDEVGEMTRSLNEVLDRLHTALEANRRFASDASHELRGPLTAMAGEIDVTLKYRRTAEEYREALGLVRERLGALTTLAEDLILLVRAQEGARGLDLREVPLLPHIRDAASRLADAARSRGLRVMVSEFPDLVVYAEPRLLGRVLDNVIGNAVQYNREGGLVAIGGAVQLGSEAEWTADTAIVTVTDTGPGIPVDEWERVFERFRRLDRARARHTGGSGLGLAICREVLAVMGGAIRVVRSSPEGTTFEIRMPGGVRTAGRETVDLVPPPAPLQPQPGSASVH